MATTWDIDQDDLIDVPDSLFDRLNQINYSKDDDPKKSHDRLHAILIEALRAEQEFTNKRVGMSLGKYLTFEVPHDDQTAVLSGTADFTVWYDNDKLARTQLVVVDRKGHGSQGPAGMTTTFMDMIHRKRKEKGYLDRVVYGCHSDGEDFTFVQVDNESFYTTKEYQWTTEPSDDKTMESTIYTHFRLMIRSAANRSVATRSYGDCRVN